MLLLREKMKALRVLPHLPVEDDSAKQENNRLTSELFSSHKFEEKFPTAITNQKTINHQLNKLQVSLSPDLGYFFFGRCFPFDKLHIPYHGHLGNAYTILLSLFQFGLNAITPPGKKQINKRIKVRKFVQGCML